MVCFTSPVATSFILSFYVKPVYVTHCDNYLKHLTAEDGSLEVLLFGEENTFLES